MLVGRIAQNKATTRLNWTSIWLPKVFLFMFFQIMFTWLIGLYARFKSRGNINAYTQCIPPVHRFGFFSIFGLNHRHEEECTFDKQITKVFVLKNGFCDRYWYWDIDARRKAVYLDNHMFGITVKFSLGQGLQKCWMPFLDEFHLLN